MFSSSTDSGHSPGHPSAPIEHTLNLIDGAWCEAVSGARLAVVDPASGRTLTHVPASGREDVDLTARAARGAAAAWARTTPRERAEMLLELADALLGDAGAFEALESLNAGKPVSIVAGEVTSAADRLRFFAGAARTLEGRAAGEYAHGYTSMTRREPVGVAALVAPWNYPLLMAATKLGPALAGGNTVVLKPSEQTPLTALRLAALAADILPPGVLNVITGEGSSAGAALVTHPEVDLISLTGDSATGKVVARAAADSLKRVHLELGGKAPAVVLDDADPVEVAVALRASGFWNSGQDCSAAARVIATAGIHDRLVEELTSAVASLRVGDPADLETEMGPVAYEGHRDRVIGFLDRAAEQGGTFLAGGFALPGDGFYIAPTIVTDVEQHSEIVQREVFGPVVTVQRVQDADAAYRFANDTAYGLGASVFTRDVSRALDAARRLRFGTVWVNDHGPVCAEMPWGGARDSGYGKERSVYSLEEFTEIKHVMVKLP